MLTLIKTKIKNKPDYNAIYYNAFMRVTGHLIDNPDDKQSLKQAVFYGVKYVVTMDDPKEIEKAALRFQMIHIINRLIEQLTPAELMSIFPVTKTFDGEKYGWKDYFYTMQTINRMGRDNLIGEKLQDLLWDYQNTDIELFLVAEMSTASDIRRMNGQKGIMEEWAEENGIATYTLHTDSTGREYIQDNTTGRTAKVKQKVPKYIRRLK